MVKDMRKIEFGTGGFRGIIGDDFRKENIVLIAQALSNIIHRRHSRKEVVIGYDFRFLSEESALWISEVFAGNHIHCLLSCEPVPTPAVMFLSKELGNDFGVMITASHNPYSFNGVKVFQQDGMDADVSLTDEIEREIARLRKIRKTEKFEEGYGQYVSVVSFLDLYLESVGKFISPEIQGSSIKVLFDAIYGTGSLTMKRLAKKYGWKNFHAIRSAHDAWFHGELPNPTRANMMKLSARVVREGYDFAFGIDSDGDRLGVLDEKGNYVDSNEILAALYYYLVKYRGEKGPCVRNIATSNLLDRVSEKLSFECHEVDVGFKNISSEMKKTDALIGGESSGGLTIRGYLYGKDSTFAAMLFAEMVIAMKKPVSEIIREVRDFADFHHVIVEETFAYRRGIDVESALLERMPSFECPPRSVVRLGKNVKYLFDGDSWVLLRVSGTEPVVRVFVETGNPRKADGYLGIVDRFIRSLDGVCV